MAGVVALRTPEKSASVVVGETVTLEEMGGARMHATVSGCGDNLAHDDHDALRLWLRMLTCTMLVERHIKARLKRRFGMSLPRFDLMAQLERAPDGHAAHHVGDQPALLGRQAHATQRCGGFHRFLLTSSSPPAPRPSCRPGGP